MSLFHIDLYLGRYLTLELMNVRVGVMVNG